MMRFSLIALWALVGAGMNLGQFRRPSPVRSGPVRRRSRYNAFQLQSWFSARVTRLCLQRAEPGSGGADNTTHLDSCWRRDTAVLEPSLRFGVTGCSTGPVTL